MHRFTTGERPELGRRTMNFGNYCSVLALLLALAGCTPDSVAPLAAAPAPGEASLTITRSRAPATSAFPCRLNRSTQHRH